MAETSAVAPRKLRVFLCHAKEDKAAVRQLYQRLRQDGFDPWLDEEDLLPGQEWQREIPRAVRAGDVVIVCSSKAFNTAGYKQQEVKLALNVADEQPEGTIYIIPLRLEECEVPESLRRWQRVDLFKPAGYQDLVRSLRLRAQAESLELDTTPPMKAPLTADNAPVAAGPPSGEQRAVEGEPPGLPAPRSWWKQRRTAIAIAAAFVVFAVAAWWIVSHRAAPASVDSTSSAAIPKSEPQFRPTVEEPPISGTTPVARGDAAKPRKSPQSDEEVHKMESKRAGAAKVDRNDASGAAEKSNSLLIPTTTKGDVVVDAQRLPRVAFGDLRRGTIERRGGRRAFVLSASTGDIAFAQAQRCNIQGGSPITMNPTIDIRDSSGKSLANASEDNTQNYVSVRGLRLKSDGLYTVEVSDLGDLAQYTGGPFALFLQRLNGPANANSLKPGTDQTAFLNSCGQIDTYTFTTQQSTRIQLSVAQVSVGGLYPRVELYDPDGAFLGDARSYDSSGTRLSPPGLVVVPAPKSGVYTALVMNLYGNGTGAYRIGVEITR